ncbi:MAG: phosphoribosylamine--glycine ligase [Candidatus Neomarinimicrobiota bacterium]|nr:MAG: phosphoribosylamine--glycine ligase [Candidatus Neomarinimicrobiota bacterium]
MNIAVIGSGGREHALAWKLQQSELAEKIFVLPGNGGTSNNVALDGSDTDALKVFCKENDIALIVVGPEVPLANGIVNAFADTDILVFGPDQAAAQLEGSKIFSKKFMKKYDVATADFQVFTAKNDPADLIKKMKGELVVKFDGLAAGKGVYVCTSEEEAFSAIEDIKIKYGDDAGYLIESKLKGQELSIIGVTDGININCLLPSQDHKAAYDGDKGPNTGGMGAYCPAPLGTEEILNKIDETIILPTLNGIEAEGFNYKGVIYFGIMLDGNVPKLLEYNVRFGDPETEVILPALKSDLLKLILASFDGSLGEMELEFYDDYFVDVVLTSGGYPGPYEKGKEISGLNDLDKTTLCFHAGTKKENNKVLTSGGRVLNIVCKDKDLKKAVDNCYDEIKKISFDGMTYRTDIAHKALT